MSEVKKWYIYTDDGVVRARASSEFEFEIITELFGKTFVLSTDYDATQSELTALREELATAKKVSDNFEAIAENRQRRMIAAEQRYAELVELLRETVPALALAASSFKAQKPTYTKVKNALKPTESGASE